MIPMIMRQQNYVYAGELIYGTGYGSDAGIHKATGGSIVPEDRVCQNKHTIDLDEISCVAKPVGLDSRRWRKVIRERTMRYWHRAVLLGSPEGDHASKSRGGFRHDGMGIAPIVAEPAVLMVEFVVRFERTRNQFRQHL
jgi:hypothetical protein